MCRVGTGQEYGRQREGVVVEGMRDQSWEEGGVTMAASTLSFGAGSILQPLISMTTAQHQRHQWRPPSVGWSGIISHQGETRLFLSAGANFPFFHAAHFLGPGGKRRLNIPRPERNPIKVMHVFDIKSPREGSIKVKDDR